MAMEAPPSTASRARNVNVSVAEINMCDRKLVGEWSHLAGPLRGRWPLLLLVVLVLDRHYERRTQGTC